MAFGRVGTGSVLGAEAHLVSVEVNINSKGFPNFSIVGLASKEIREAKERVRSAIKNSGYRFPLGNITVNLSPADLPKFGSWYDLPIAIGILKASGNIEADLSRFVFAGELGLDGSITLEMQVFGLACVAKSQGKTVVIGTTTTCIFSFLKYKKIFIVKNFREVVEFLNGIRVLPHLEIFNKKQQQNRLRDIKDFTTDSIKGNYLAKRALMISIAGGHNIFFLGSPGSGKTSLCLSSRYLLPRFDLEEDFENLIENIKFKIFSKSLVDRDLNKFADIDWIYDRPFRNPHYSISPSNIIGGGVGLNLGEVALANNGILYIDEIFHAKRQVLDLLKTPIDERKINLSRFGRNYTYKTDFIFIASGNPCPCGNWGSMREACVCKPHAVKSYKEKFSYSLQDRMDIGVSCYESIVSELNSKSNSNVKNLKTPENHADEYSYPKIYEKIYAARKVQQIRYVEYPEIDMNAHLGIDTVEKFCLIDPKLNTYFENQVDILGLSNRSYHRILKVARTIADLENREKIELSDLNEAIQYKITLRDILKP